MSSDDFTLRRRAHTFIVGGVRSLRSRPQETVEPTVCAPRTLTRPRNVDEHQQKGPGGCGFASALVPLAVFRAAIHCVLLRLGKQASSCQANSCSFAQQIPPPLDRCSPKALTGETHKAEESAARKMLRSTLSLRPASLRGARRLSATAKVRNRCRNRAFVRSSSMAWWGSRPRNVAAAIASRARNGDV